MKPSRRERLEGLRPFQPYNFNREFLSGGNGCGTILSRRERLEGRLPFQSYNPTVSSFFVRDGISRWGNC
jgi:hypothetical protein